MGLHSNDSIDNTYYIRSKIDSGGEGSVYAAHDGDGRTYAVKASRGSTSLNREYRAYKRLGCTKHNREFLPRIYHFSTHRGHKVMVMNRFETSLDDLRRKNGGSFSMPTVLKIGIKLVRMLQYIHSKGVLHGDVKPSNIMLSKQQGRLARFYLVDFGCSHSYVSGHGSQHISDSIYSFYGTHLFASPRAHAEKVQSRRDDLKSLAYVLVYLVKGTLPWKRLGVSDMGHMKNDISIESLCSGTWGLKEYATQVWKLSFAEKPDYASLMTILDSALIRLKRTNRIRYDWE
ncbi:unnamed protein product [Agarophyton chilense]|eukprot:gb/GEZJ01000301.1/.p1 GENE.gb/GEZJ01000301.1/~~gb/GEZJ01000301.1/.p1  ORF type:complete len:288 (+),score=25.22 gb/GEZJ01000301.1/:2276-3139(+)